MPMSRFTGFSEKYKKKNLKYWQSIGSDAITLNFSKGLDFTDCHAGFGENRFFKVTWCNQFKLLLFGKNFFFDGLPLFKLTFFFLKLKIILTKIDISCVKSWREKARPTTHLHQLEGKCGKIRYVSDPQFLKKVAT